VKGMKGVKGFKYYIEIPRDCRDKETWPKPFTPFTPGCSEPATGNQTLHRPFTPPAAPVMPATACGRDSEPKKVQKSSKRRKTKKAR